MAALDAEAVAVMTGPGIRVTVEDLFTGQSESTVIWDDYLLIVAGDCQRGSVQVYPKSGTHVVSIKNVGGKR